MVKAIVASLIAGLLLELVRWLLGRAVKSSIISNRHHKDITLISR